MIKICCVQITSRQDINENISKISQFTEEACRERSDIIVLPEMFPFFGNPGEEIKCAVSESDTGYIANLIKLSGHYKNIIVCGSIPVKSENPSLITNRSYIVSEGKISGFYDKIHLFDIDIKDKASFSESSYTKKGNKVAVFPNSSINIGIAICFDLRFSWLFSEMNKKGAGLIALPSAFLEHTGKDHWEILLRARAIENQVFIAASNQFGRHNKTRRTYGRSMIIDPWGTVLACAPDYETNIYACINKGYQQKIRSQLSINQK